METKTATEITIDGVYQTIGYLSIKGMPLSEAQLDGLRQMVEQMEKQHDK